MSSASQYMRFVATASLAKARKKVPGLKWVMGMLLNADTGEACIQGIKDLEICMTVEKIGDVGYHEGMESLPDVLSGWDAEVLTDCPIMGCEEETPSTAESAVAHINDDHAHSLAEAKRLLLQWAEREIKVGDTGQL